jgi:hypothetical protein
MRALTVMAVIVGLLLASFEAAAKQADYVSVGRTLNQNFGTWAIGDGSISLVMTVCIASANYDDRNPKAPDAAQMPYQFKVASLATPPGHILYLDGIDTNTGNATIQVQFEHQDTMQPVPYEVLTDDVYDLHAHLGQYRNCASGDNSQVRMSIPSTQLEAAKAGTYFTDFRMTAIGGSSGTATDFDDMTVRLTVANAVRVSALENLNLGLWDGMSDLVAEETFCVYSNTAGSTYDVTMSSPNQDGAGNFLLANIGATATIPYLLQFKDDTTAGGGITVATAALSGVGNSDAVDCGGIDNSKLTVTILAADLALAPTDLYSDTITIVVVPI